MKACLTFVVAAVFFMSAPVLSGDRTAATQPDVVHKVDSRLVGKLIKVGKRLALEGMRDDAAIVFQATLLLEPGNCDALLYIATIQAYQGKIKKSAADAYRKFARSCPQHKLRSQVQQIVADYNRHAATYEPAPAFREAKASKSPGRLASLPHPQALVTQRKVTSCRHLLPSIAWHSGRHLRGIDLEIERATSSGNPAMAGRLRELNELYTRGAARTARADSYKAIDRLERALVINRELFGSCKQYHPQIARKLSSHYYLLGVHVLTSRKYVKAHEAFLMSLEHRPDFDPAADKLWELERVAKKLYEEAYVVQYVNSALAIKNLETVWQLVPEGHAYSMRAGRMLERIQPE